MDGLVDLVSVVVYVGLALAALGFARRQAGPAARWAVATFAALAAFVVAGTVTDGLSASGSRWSIEALVVDLVVALLGAFPYLLHRFARSLRGRASRVDRAADVVGAALLAWTLTLPPFPPPDAPQPSWVALYTVVFMAWWTGLFLWTSVRLWRMGTRQPGVVRGRMRLVAGAAAIMAAAFLGVVVGGDNPRFALAMTVLGWIAAIGFLMGLQPLPALRRIWRTGDEAALRDAEVGLITARTPEEAGDAIVVAAAAAVGGAGATVTTRTGRPLSTWGTMAEGREPLVVDGARSVVSVSPSSLTPILGHGEESLLRQLCTHLDLALARLDAAAASEAARAEAEQANADLQQLVYGVSHDLRNPLVTITGFLGLLEQDPALSERSTMLVGRMQASARYMRGLVDDLLQLSRVGHADVERSAVALGPLVRSVSDDLISRYPELDVVAADLPAVDMNPVRARQVMSNLIENAARYARPDGGPVAVSVSAAVDGSWAVVDVADDGVGIPADQRERVFQIFQRLEGFDAASEGSGIGLTMVRRILSDVGGSIHIADTPRGTTMRLRLPLATAAARGPAEPAPAAPAAPSDRVGTGR